MKQLLKQLISTLKVGAMAILLLSTVACDKDDEPTIQKTAFEPTSLQGNNLKLTYPDGKIEYIKGDNIIGWGRERY